MELLHPRSRPFTRVPLGRGRLGRVSDDKQRLCFALALWNGKDPILKERLFGLTDSEGNHGEDVKEYYFCLESTLTHSYMKFLYKYPQAAYPYADLVETNRRRTRNEMEYELLDTGVFNEDRYFDVLVEYAKASPEDILIRITASNRAEEAELHVLPTLWFRNVWASWLTHRAEKPMLSQIDGRAGTSTIAATHAELGVLHLYCEGAAPPTTGMAMRGWRSTTPTPCIAVVATSGTETGSTRSTTTSFPCPTSGSTTGTPLAAHLVDGVLGGLPGRSPDARGRRRAVPPARACGARRSAARGRARRRACPHSRPASPRFGKAFCDRIHRRWIRRRAACSPVMG